MSLIAGQTLTQVDRMGLPAVNTAFVSASADKNAFNLGAPANDQQRFLGTLVQTIRTRFGLSGAQAERLADFVLPDVLPLGDLTGFPNGRRLADDVIDIAEQVMAGFLKGNKVPLGDGVDGPDVPAMSFFPYETDPAGGAANTKGLQK